jgi:hyperosmotically inducible protein
MGHFLSHARTGENAMSKIPRLACTLMCALSLGIAQADEASDKKITAEVQHVLSTNAETDENKIEVQTRDGVVQLSGFVNSGRLKAAATTNARSVNGVKEVKNNLIVREGERTLAQGGEDSIIAAKVQKVLASGAKQSDDVDVQVRGGVVQLSGFVASDQTRTELERAARNIAGVAEVRNDIRVSK